MTRINQSGIGIIGVVASLAVIALMITVAMPLLKSVSDGNTKEIWVNRQAKEMMMVKEAMQGWAAVNEGATALSVTVSVGIQELIDMGLLPVKFAQADPLNTASIGTAPLGADYNVYLRKDTIDGKEVLRGIVIDEGDNAQTNILRAGLKTLSTNGYRDITSQWSRSVTNALMSNHGVIGGTNMRATKIVNGQHGGFKIDLTDFISSTDNNRARTVAFFGFLEFETDSDDGNNTTSGPIYDDAACNLAVINSCPAGQTELARFPVCDRDLPNIIGVPEIGGAITWGYHYYNPPAFTLKYTGPQTPKPVFARYRDKIYQREYTVNQGGALTIECASQKWHNYNFPAAIHPGTPRRPHAHYKQLKATTHDELICKSDTEVQIVLDSYTGLAPPIPAAEAFCLSTVEFLNKLGSTSGPDAILCCEDL